MRAEKMGLDPEKLRELLAREAQQQDEPTQPEAAGPGPGEPAERLDEPFHFDVKPEELENYLNQYVIRQYEAKGILAPKICTHFNRLNLPDDDADDDDHSKTMTPLTMTTTTTMLMTALTLAIGLGHTCSFSYSFR